LDARYFKTHFVAERLDLKGFGQKRGSALQAVVERWPKAAVMRSTQRSIRPWLKGNESLMKGNAFRRYERVWGLKKVQLFSNRFLLHFFKS